MIPAGTLYLAPSRERAEEIARSLCGSVVVVVVPVGDGRWAVRRRE